MLWNVSVYLLQKSNGQFSIMEPPGSSAGYWYFHVEAPLF